MIKIIDRLEGLPLFLPVSTGLNLWHLLIIFIMIADLVITVLVQCFREPISKILLMNVINPSLPVLLLLQILISLNTGYIKSGKIILQRKPANSQYLHSLYFICDIFSLFISIIQLIFMNTFLPQMTLLNYLIFIKLIKCVQFDSLLKKYVIKSFSYLLYYQVVKNFIVLIMVCHFIGSFYFFLDRVLYQQYNYQQQQLWVFSSYAMNDIYTQDFNVQYTYSFYFAVVTLSGTCYGDILPLNPIQTSYVFSCFIVPMLIYAYVFSSIFTALQNRRSASLKIRRIKFLAKQYLKSLGVNPKVMNKIVTYLQFTYKKDMVINKQFLNDLAPTVKQQYLNVNVDGRFKYDCFSIILSYANLDQQYLKYKLAEIINHQYFPQRFSLLTSEKLKIYYINSGKIVEVIRLKEDKKLSKDLNNTSHIAKTAFFTNQIPTQKIRYQSNSFVVCHSIEYKQFKEIIKSKMPTLNQAFCLLQCQILDQGKFSLMQQKCYFCDQTSHILQNCPYLNPNRNQMLNKSHQYIQPRSKYNRDGYKPKPKQIRRSSIFMKLSEYGHLNDKNVKRKNRKIYVSERKKVQGNLLSMLMDQKFYQFLATFIVKNKTYAQQVQYKAIRQFLPEHKFQYQHVFEKVCFWDNFYPKKNFT